MGLSNDSRSASNLGAFLQAALVAVALLPLTFVGGCKSNGGLIRGNDAKKTNLCPNCAYDLTPLNKADEPAKFCPRCGKPIEASASDNSSTSYYSEPSSNAGEAIAAEVNADLERRQMINNSAYAFEQETPKEAEASASADPTQGSLVPNDGGADRPLGAQFADDFDQPAAEKSIEQVAKEQVEAARQTAEQAQQAIAAQADAAQAAVKDAADAVKDKTAAAVDAVKETAKETADAIEETAEAVKETAKEAAEKAEETANAVVETAENAVENVKKAAESGAEAAQNAVENVKEAAESGAEAVQNAAESVKQAGEDAAKEVEHSANKIEGEAVPAADDPNDDSNWKEDMVKSGGSKPILQHASASSDSKKAQMKTVSFKKSAVPAKTAAGKSSTASKSKSKGASSKPSGSAGSQKKSGKSGASRK